MKKGRHRRFEEARSLKRSVATDGARCPECGAEAEDVHASWCLAEEDRYDRILVAKSGEVVEDKEGVHMREDVPLVPDDAEMQALTGSPVPVTSA